MTYEVWQGFAQNDAGDVLDTATVTVTLAGTATKPALFSDEDGTGSKTNPFTTDASGFVQFYTAPAIVDIVATKGAFSVTFSNVRIGLPDALQTVATLAELQGVDASSFDGGETFSMKTRTTLFSPFVDSVASGGDFVWCVGNFTTLSDIDSYQSVIVVSDYVSVAVGAFVRRISDGLHVTWAGVGETEATDYSLQAQSVVDLAAAINVADVWFPGRTIICNIEAGKTSTRIRGQGVGRTIFKPTATDAPVFTVHPDGTEGISEKQINFVEFHNFQIDGSDYTSVDDRHGISVIAPDYSGSGTDTTTVGINNLVINSVDIRDMSGRGVKLQAIPNADQSPALNRYIQNVSITNSFILRCLRTGLWVDGHVIESQFNGFRCSNNGSATSGNGTATLADKLESNIVIRAREIKALPTSIADYIFPGRIKFSGLVTAEGTKTKSGEATGVHEGLTFYINGGREIVIDTWDMENGYTCMEIDRYVGPSDVSNTHTVWSVDVGNVNIQQGTSKTELNEFIRAEALVKLSHGNWRAPNASAASKGVNIIPTTYSEVNSVINRGGISMSAGVASVDARAETLNASGNLTIRQAGHIALLGNGSADDVLETITYNSPSYTQSDGDVIRLSNYSNSAKITAHAYQLEAAARPVYLKEDIQMNSTRDSLSLQYVAKIDAWEEIGRSIAVKTLRTTTATPAAIWTTNMETDETSVTIQADVQAHRFASTEVASYKIVGTFKKDGGTVSQVGATGVLYSVEQDAAWNVDFGISGSDVSINVTGNTGDSIDWQLTNISFVTNQTL